MAYRFHCRECDSDTWVKNIDELFKKHTDSSGRFICHKCKSTDTYIHKSNDLQEPGEIWERWIKGVIRINTEYPTYFPYVFLIADKEDGDINGWQCNYYKDLRSQGGRLKPGAGPGGSPVLAVEDLFHILRHLLEVGVLTKQDVLDRISQM